MSLRIIDIEGNSSSFIALITQNEENYRVKNTTPIEKYELQNGEKRYRFQIYVEINPLTYKTFQLQKKSNPYQLRL